MNSTSCNLCKNPTQFIFTGKILNKYDVRYFHCKRCDLLQTETPYWLDEAYSNTITMSDTGYVSRNLTVSNQLTVIISVLWGSKDTFLDFAGGYGLLVRLMRDVGFKFYWTDKYTQNALAPGFEWDKKSKFRATTAVEVFEHFVDPTTEIENLLATSGNLFFTTELYGSSPPVFKDWWYYGPEHGQHVSFYSERTIGFLAEKYKLHYANAGMLHLLTQDKIPKWKLILIQVFIKFRMHLVLRRFLKSKTLDDHHLMAVKGGGTP